MHDLTKDFELIWIILDDVYVDFCRGTSASGCPVLRFAVDYRIMETVVSEMSHFPVRLMSFLHTPFKIKCKYAVFTAIVTKGRRPDAIRNATR